jgi:hypothetical protein
MSRKAKYLGRDIADKYLGHEKNIPMSVEDPRYRYYQWLREWYGMGKREATNKCPFYQFMFWGSLLMIVSLVPILLMKLVEVIVLKPLAGVIPDTIDEINKTIGKSKMLTSWALFLIVIIGFLIFNGFSLEIIAWIGVVIHAIFAIPVLVLVFLWYGFVWLFLEAIPFLWNGIGIVFFGVLHICWYIIVGLLSLPWNDIFYWVFLILGTLLASALFLWAGYRFGKWVFSSKLSAWAIQKSCVIREAQLKKRKARRVAIRKAQQEKAAKRIKWERENAEELRRQDEIARQKRIEKENSRKKWRELFNTIFKHVWAFLCVFPGFVFIGIWMGLKALGYGFVHVIIGCAWLTDKIGDGFVIVWSLLTETISNHCPPIDFMLNVNEVGKLRKRKGHLLFSGDSGQHTLIFHETELPDIKLVEGDPAIRGTLKGTVLTRALDGGPYYDYHLYEKFRDYVNPVQMNSVEEFIPEVVPPKKKSKK